MINNGNGNLKNGRMTNATAVMAVLALAAFGVHAMPTDSELEKAKPLVRELMESKMAELKAKKITASELADAVMEYASEAETEAAKFLLLRGAVSYYARDKKYDRAADAVVALRSSVSDIPPDQLSAILSKAVSRATVKTAPRLYKMLKDANRRASAVKEAKSLQGKLYMKPEDQHLRRQYAECLAASGNWKQALIEFGKLGGKTAEMANAEKDGNVQNLECGEFWWNYKPVVDGVEYAIKERAAEFYRKAIASDEIKGLKKTIIEKRIAEYGGDGNVDDADVAEKAETEDDVPVETEAKPEKENNAVAESSTCSGTQKVDVVELGPKRKYVFVHKYTVPVGKELIVKKGTTLIFEKGASLFVQGKITIEGEKSAPVIMKGISSSVGDWEGVTVSGNNGSTAAYVHVSGAKCGLSVVENGSCMNVSNSTFYRNDIGFRASGCRPENKNSILEQCMFCENRLHGVSLNFAGVMMVNCTVVNNGDVGIRGHYYGKVVAQKCEITRNRQGGLKQDLYECMANVTQSAIYDNTLFDVNNSGSKSFNFQECWWGDKNTALLKKNGDGFQLKSITGSGDVNVADFLSKKPKDCGATDYPDINTKAVSQFEKQNTVEGKETASVINVKNAVAEIEGVKYESLSDAFWSSDGKTIKMLRDVLHENHVVDQNANAVLDLNGHIITGAGNGYAIFVKRSASLKMLDSSKKGTGKIVAPKKTEGDCGGVFAEGTFIMSGGTIEKCWAGGGGAVNVRGSFFMEGGTIRDCNAKWGGAIYFGGRQCVISGGTIENCNSNNGTIRLRSGEFSITGGKVGGGFRYDGGCSISISGGEFQQSPSADWLAKGCAVKKGKTREWPFVVTRQKK